MVAYLALDTTNPFFTDVATGIEQVVRDAKLGLFLCNSDQDATREDEYLERFQEQRVRGICITAVDYGNPRLRRLPLSGIPVVLVDRAENGPAGGHEWCSVGVNDIAGGELAITHLIEQGHQRLGFVGGPLTIPQVSDRLTGARRAMAASGADESALVVLEAEALTVTQGKRAGELLLGLPKQRRPTAVLCANDLLALGLLQQMSQRGVHVPADMAIVGYDNIEFAAAAAVPLTSVNQPRLELGRAAAELVLAESAHDPSHTHRHIQFEPALVVRSSSPG
jgi:LacI family transcriptional regulator